MSADGYITITGRIKDLIIRGGENIHPLEIENCLFANPHVLNVSVVGVPDGRYGEVVAAFVVPREEGQKKISVPEIKEWVRQKLSHHLGKCFFRLRNCLSFTVPFHAFSPALFQESKDTNAVLLLDYSAEIHLLHRGR